MTPGYIVFWLYLAGLGFLAGIPAIVFGLIARLLARPFDTPRRMNVWMALLVPTVVLGITSSVLSYNLVSSGGVVPWVRANSLIGPISSAVIIFFWASGFPVRRVLLGRR